MKYCKEALAGEVMEMRPKADGSYACAGCGASEQVVRRSREKRQDDWSNYRDLAPRTLLGRLWASLLQRI